MIDRHLLFGFVCDQFNMNDFSIRNWCKFVTISLFYQCCYGPYKDLDEMEIINKYEFGSESRKGGHSTVIFGNEIDEPMLWIAMKLEEINNNQTSKLNNEILILTYLTKDEPNNLNSGILKPIDVGEYDGCKAMILPGLEDDLQIWYEGIDIFLWNEVCNIAWDLFDRLEFIHGKGIVHQDIKPENLAKGIYDAETARQFGASCNEKIYIFDFSVSAFFNDGYADVQGEIVGTLEYMSPRALEGWHGLPVDDCHSAILTLIALYSGDFKWHDKSREEIIEDRKIYNSARKIIQEFEYDHKEIAIQAFQECFDHLEEVPLGDLPNYSLLKSYFRSAE